MLIDKLNQFSADAGDSPTLVGSTASTNTIDLGIARDIGGAVTDQLMNMAQVITAFTSGGAATLKLQFQASNDASTWTTIAQTDDVPVASLVQGYRFLNGEIVNYPGSTLYRYLRFNYVIGTAVMTAGALKAGFVPSLDVQPVYARGYTA